MKPTPVGLCCQAIILLHGLEAFHGVDRKRPILISRKCCSHPGLVNHTFLQVGHLGILRSSNNLTVSVFFFVWQAYLEAIFGHPFFQETNQDKIMSVARPEPPPRLLLSPLVIFFFFAKLARLCSS